MSTRDGDKSCEGVSKEERKGQDEREEERGGRSDRRGARRLEPDRERDSMATGYHGESDKDRLQVQLDSRKVRERRTKR